MINDETLKKLAKRVKFAAAPKGEKYSVVVIEKEHAGASLVATNGHMMATLRLPDDVKPRSNNLDTLENFTTYEVDLVTGTCENRAWDFPNWKNVAYPAVEPAFEGDRKKFLEALKAAKNLYTVFTQSQAVDESYRKALKGYKAVAVLDIETGEISISAPSPLEGLTDQVWSVKNRQERNRELKVGFNLDYMIKILTNLKGAWVKIEVDKGEPEVRAFQVTASDDPLKVVAMPVRISSPAVEEAPPKTQTVKTKAKSSPKAVPACLNKPVAKPEPNPEPVSKPEPVAVEGQFKAQIKRPCRTYWRTKFVGDYQSALEFIRNQKRHLWRVVDEAGNVKHEEAKAVA